MSARALLILVSVTGLAGCMDQQAEHAWDLTLEPDGAERYALEVPFLAQRGTGEDPDPVLVALREEVEVTAGNATFTWTENDTVLTVEAQGPATLEARHAFRGPVEQRESFARWSLPDDEVARADGGGPPVQVTWHIDLSGGEGHSCYAEATLHADVPAQGSAILANPRGAEPWGVECN